MEPDWHTCHFCGEYVKDGHDPKGNRHYLSDCRPDLTEHERGPLCTWHDFAGPARHSCYAYQGKGDKSTGYRPVWTDEHIHFYPDGPM